MTIILTTTDEPYRTTYSPPPTTRLALNAFSVLRRPSLCESMDLKDEDRQVPWTPGLFSGKQLIAAMCLELRKQKPLSDALDGSCLLCEEHMQQAWWEGGHAGSLWRQASSWSESRQGLTTSPWCRCSPHMRWWYTFYSIPLMLRKGGTVWASVIYLINLHRWYGSPPLISESRGVLNLK